MEKKRCAWVPLHQLDYVAYHDEEWGKPVYEDQKLFEMLCLEGAQAGLSWYSVLKRREGYRTAFQGFDPIKAANLTDEQLEDILKTGDIIRNRLKVFSVRHNAVIFMSIQKEFGTFSAYLWGFVKGKTQGHRPLTKGEIRVKSPESDRLAHDLKRRGMKFVGSTILYAYMQAVGLIDDHMADCFLGLNS